MPSPSAAGQVPVRAAALCLLHAGLTEQARQILDTAGAGPGDGGPEMAYLWAVVHARAGREREAYQILSGLRDRGDLAPQPRGLLLSLAKRLAFAALKRKDLVAASEHIGLALELDPDDPQVRAMGSLAREAIPWAHIVRGQREKAVEIWEHAWRRTPREPALWHHLALAYWFESLASAEKAASHPPRPDSGPRGAGEPVWAERLRTGLGFWGALAACPAYWVLWVEGRVRACRMEKVDVTDAPAKCLETIVNRLKSELLGRRDAAIQRHDDLLADVLEGLLVDLVTEIRASGFLREAQEKGLAPKDLPPMGPIALRRLGRLDAAKSAASGRRLKRSPLALYLDGAGRVVAAVEEKLTARAWRESKALVAAGGDGKGTALCALALAAEAHGSDLASRGLYKEAFELLTEAQQLGALRAGSHPGIPDVSLGPTAARLAEEAVKGYQRRAERLDSDAGERPIATVGEKKLLLLREGVHVLEAAVKVSKEASRQLSQMLVEVCEHLRALSTFQMNEEGKRDPRRKEKPMPQRYDEAIAAAREAVKVAPGYRNAAQCLSELLSNKGVYDCNRGQTAVGVALVREALKIDPNNAHARQNLGLILVNESVTAWNSGGHNRALSLMAEAVQLSPADSHVRGMAIELLQAADQLSWSSEYSELLSSLRRSGGGE
jgi:tetratricopeptide (TPR) repeat protein